MKIIKVLITSLVFVITVNFAHAQVNLQVNIGAQPVWGPTGYDHADYYYLPDMDAYYSVAKQQYVYREGNAWVFRKSLPQQYAHTDLYKSYKVVINERKPWLKDNEYRTKYQSYRNRHDQPVIRDSHEEKYYVIKQHPDHDKWVKQKRHH